jgi:hypothetical protein
MQYRELHPWHVSVAEAQRIQQRLRHHIQVGTYVRDLRYIAGADIAVAPTSPTVYAGVAVLDYTTLAIVERNDTVSATDVSQSPHDSPISMLGPCVRRRVEECEEGMASMQQSISDAWHSPDLRPLLHGHRSTR